jgi:hypothetical protein
LATLTLTLTLTHCLNANHNRNLNGPNFDGRAVHRPPQPRLRETFRFLPFELGLKFVYRRGVEVNVNVNVRGPM